MPSIVRKLRIFAGEDGLQCQPVARSGRTGNAAALQVGYAHIHNGFKVTAIQEATENDEKQETAVASSRNKKNEQDDREANENSLEAYGIIGLLHVGSSAFLIVITGREEVARLWTKPVYMIKRVAIIPATNLEEASRAITQIKHSQIAKGPPYGEAAGVTSPVSSTFDEADNEPIMNLEDTWLDEHVRQSGGIAQQSSNSEPQQPSTPDTRIAKDVIQRKGLYGRFAQSWFSRGGWAADKLRNQGMTINSEDNLAALQPSAEIADSTTLSTTEATPIAQRRFMDVATTKTSASKALADAEAKIERERREHDTTTQLLPKIVQTMRMLFTSNTFFFAYDLDITRSLARQQSAGSDLPLWKQVLPVYFWNFELSESFFDEGLDDFILPVMQGFVNQRVFTLETSISGSEKATEQVNEASDAQLESMEKVEVEADQPEEQPYNITLISRRSTKRAGLRYLRRGIDDNGNVANGVETEQLLCKPDWDEVHSFVQVRGSIPLFYSQSPYSFKPKAVLHGSQEANQQAFRKHFAMLSNTYGDIQAVSLVDKHGTEAPVGQAYEKHVHLLNESGALPNRQSLCFNWFDFHNICRGMKFQNVSQLLDELTEYLETIGWTVRTTKDQDRSESVSMPEISKRQRGTIRTNCMDCLDRTNVVQSTIALHILSEQLSQVTGNEVSLDLPTTIRQGEKQAQSPPLTWFNTLWADNGDAVSRAYAGTAALKGDYTRTRTRNLKGVITDFTLSVNRYYRNIFEDFFTQAVIDRLLGNVGDEAFVEFEEKMTTADPGIDLHRARQSAITSAVGVVVSESEDFLHGWAVSAPASTVPAASTAPANTGNPKSKPKPQKTAQSQAQQLLSQPFAEILLLLTNRAIYTIWYDWTDESVRSSARFPLSQIRKIQHGTYITDTVTKSQTDPSKNLGVMLEVEVAKDKPMLVRVNTGTAESVGTIDADVSVTDRSSSQEARPTRILAFKALAPPPAPHHHHHTDPTDDTASTSEIRSRSRRRSSLTRSPAPLSRSRTLSQSLPSIGPGADAFSPPVDSTPVANATALSSTAGGAPSERDTIEQIVSELLRAISKNAIAETENAGSYETTVTEDAGAMTTSGQKPALALEEAPLVTLTDARRAANGYLGGLGLGVNLGAVEWSLKKLVWG